MSEQPFLIAGGPDLFVRKHYLVAAATKIYWSEEQMIADNPEVDFTRIREEKWPLRAKPSTLR